MKSYFIFLFAILSCSFVYSQNVGIGTTTPQASFNVAAGKTVLFGTDTSSAGNKLMWLPNKGAFRVGNYPNSVNDSIGIFSFASGSSIANGRYATAMGNSIASGDSSSAFGNGAANGALSTAMGNSYSNGNYSTAMGNSSAKGQYSNSMGVSTANGDYSTAMGAGSALGQYSVAMGGSGALADYSTSMGGSVAHTIFSTAMGNSNAWGQYSTSMGNSLAYENYSTSMGNGTSSYSPNETVVGTFNDKNNSDRLFEIGNGTSSSSLHNAFTVLTNGFVGIGNSEPTLAGLVVDTKIGAVNAIFGSNTTGVGIESSWPGIGLNTYYNGGRYFIGTGYGGLISLNQSNGDMYFYGFGSGTAGAATGTATGMGLSSNSLFPLTDNVYNLGNSLDRWANVWAVNGVIQTSDARLKKNITSSTYGLKEIMKLQPVTYDWKDGNNKQPMLGLLAQEVQKLIPEAVVGNEQKEYLGIKYDALIPVLIKGMQELENQNEIEENKNEILGEKNTSLEKTNALILSKLSDVTTQLETLQKQVETLAAIQKGNSSLTATVK